MNEPRVNFSTNGAKAPIPSTSASTPVCPVVMPGRHQRCWQPSANISEMAPASSPEKLWRETRGNLVVNFTDKSHFLLEPVRCSCSVSASARCAASRASAAFACSAGRASCVCARRGAPQALVEVVLDARRRTPFDTFFIEEASRATAMHTSLSP